MVKGWKPVVVPDELFDVATGYYEKNKEQLRLKHGVRSLTAFFNYCIRQYLKSKGII